MKYIRCDYAFLWAVLPTVGLYVYYVVQGAHSFWAWTDETPPTTILKESYEQYFLKVLQLFNVQYAPWYS